MAGKKKKAIDDTQSQSSGAEFPEGGSTSLADFIVPQKVDAFCNAYTPCDYEDETTEVFTDARLREFFKAWICPLGDPLATYLTLLSARGYTMRVSITGEPAIFVVHSS
jgi:hypothetical protein